MPKNDNNKALQDEELKMRQKRKKLQAEQEEEEERKRKRLQNQVTAIDDENLEEYVDALISYLEQFKPRFRENLLNNKKIELCANN